jgi:hypothetical protein
MGGEGGWLVKKEEEGEGEGPEREPERELYSQNEQDGGGKESCHQSRWRGEKSK